MITPKYNATLTAGAKAAVEHLLKLIREFYKEHKDHPDLNLLLNAEMNCWASNCFSRYLHSDTTHWRKNKLLTKAVKNLQFKAVISQTNPPTVQFSYRNYKEKAAVVWGADDEWAQLTEALKDIPKEYPLLTNNEWESMPTIFPNLSSIASIKF